MFMSNIDHFIFDCDGVLWSGMTPVPQANRTIQMLRDMGKRVTFVTNNATKTLSEIKAKFKAMNIPVNGCKVYTAAVAAAEYLKSLHLPQGAKVYVVGSPALDAEIHRIMGDGAVRTFGINDRGKVWSDFTADIDGSFEEICGGFSAVVASWDGEFNFYKLCRASTIIRSSPDVHFIATNRDQASPLLPGLLVPGGGSVVVSVETASGKTPVTTGKPDATLARQIVLASNIEAARTCMVGDRLNTDMLFGLRSDMQTLLVLSGATSEGELHSTPRPERPYRFATSISVMLRALDKTSAKIMDMRSAHDAWSEAFCVREKRRPQLDDIKSDPKAWERMVRMKDAEKDAAEPPKRGQCTFFMRKKRRFCQFRECSSGVGMCSIHRESIAVADNAASQPAKKEASHDAPKAHEEPARKR